MYRPGLLAIELKERPITNIPKLDLHSHYDITTELHALKTSVNLLIDAVNNKPLPLTDQLCIVCKKDQLHKQYTDSEYVKCLICYTVQPNTGGRFTE